MRRVLPFFAVALVGCSSLVDPPNSCFVAGTMVRTPSSSIAIERLREGDLVLAFRESDGAIVPQRVVATFGSLVSRVRVFDLEDGGAITTTDEHPFWDGERRAWIPAREVTRGTVLARIEADGRTTRPVVVRATRDEVRSPTRVFNLTVEGEHTFFAGNVATHNKEPACRGPCGGGGFGATALTIENRTEESVDVDVRNPKEDVSVSRDVAEGTTRVPFAAALFGDTMGFVVTSRSSIGAGTPVVIDRGEPTSNQQMAAAVVVSVHGSAPVMAIGSGKLLLVRRDGSVVIEAEDPRSIVVMPAEGDAKQCAPEPNVEGFDVGADLLQEVGSSVSLTAIEPWDNCKRITFRSSLDRSVGIRVCMSSETFPFTIGDALTVEDTAERGAKGIRLSREDGTTLDLLHLETRARTSFAFEGIDLVRTDGESACTTNKSWNTRLETPSSASVRAAPTDGRRVVSLGGAACHAALGGGDPCSGAATLDVAIITSPP